MTRRRIYKSLKKGLYECKKTVDSVNGKDVYFVKGRVYDTSKRIRATCFEEDTLYLKSDFYPIMAVNKNYFRQIRRRTK